MTSYYISRTSPPYLPYISATVTSYSCATLTLALPLTLGIPNRYPNPNPYPNPDPGTRRDPSPRHP